MCHRVPRGWSGLFQFALDTGAFDVIFNPAKVEPDPPSGQSLRLWHQFSRLLEQFSALINRFDRSVDHPVESLVIGSPRGHRVGRNLDHDEFEIH